MSIPKRPIAYIAQTFPALTQTFVYREVAALESRGFEVVTCAIWRPDPARLSAEAKHWVERSVYVLPVSWPLSWPRFLAVHLRYMVTRPWRYWSTLFFVLTRRGESAHNRLRTLFHFCEAVYLAPEMERRDVGHVHAHFTINAATVALVLARLLGISFSFTAHNIFFSDRLLLTAKVREARFIVAISEFTKRFLLRLVPGDGLADKIHIVHCGLSPEDFVPLPRSSSEVSETPNILFVAQLSERKGAPVLVEACRLLAERDVAFRCTIVGDGPQRPLVERLIAQYGLEGRIEMTGALPQERLRGHLARADLFALPCITARDGDMDGIPVSLMEAMAMEVPVVSTTVSGIPELIEDGKSGLLVPEKDALALADGLQRLLTDAARRTRLGKAGRQKILDEFDIRRNVDALAALFEEYLVGWGRARER